MYTHDVSQSFNRFSPLDNIKIHISKDTKDVDNNDIYEHFISIVNNSKDAAGCGIE